MTDKPITSRDNPLVKQARAVRDGRHREQVFVEGLRLGEEAEQALGAGGIVCALYTERVAQSPRGEALLGALRRGNVPVTCVTMQVFASLSSMKTPEGIVLLARRPASGRAGLLKRLGELPLLVVLHRINNPANAGAILRTAEAAGATGAITTEGTTDIFAPKALRGSMGSGFRLPLWTRAGFEEVLELCASKGIRTVCADLHASVSHTGIDWNKPSALIVGSEASGLESAEIAAADEALKIPMRAPVESLNVAVAAGIILYEAARQRQ